MGKINFRQMDRPAPAVETRTFHDPDCEEPIVITFSARADFPEIMEIQALTEQWVQRYAQPTSVPPATGDGSIIRVTPMLCQVIATIQVLEQPDADDQRYTFEDWACASVCTRTAFPEIVAFAEEIMVRSKAGRGEKPTIPNG